MNSLSNLEKQLNVLDLLSRVSIEFGIFTEDATKSVTVNILNTDDSITETIMDVGDVMYLTEYGTLTIPARPILDNCIYYVSTNFEDELNKIIEGVLNYNWTKDDIIKRLDDFAIKTEIFVKGKMEEIVASNATLSNLLNVEDENKYLYDLKKLKNYIKCKIILTESRRK